MVTLQIRFSFSPSYEYHLLRETPVGHSIYGSRVTTFRKMQFVPRLNESPDPDQLRHQPPLASARLIAGRILLIRGQHVILDADLADLYGVQTKAFNQAIKRNQGRFPTDFMFQLTADEHEGLRSQIVTSNVGRGGRRSVLDSVKQRGRGTCWLTRLLGFHLVVAALNLLLAGGLFAAIALHLVQLEDGRVVNQAIDGG